MCGKDLLHGFSCSEFVQYQFDGDPSSCHGWFSHHDFGIGCDEAFRHTSTVYRDLQKAPRWCQTMRS